MQSAIFFLKLKSFGWKPFQALWFLSEQDYYLVFVQGHFNPGEKLEMERAAWSECHFPSSKYANVSSLVGIIELCKCINHFTPRATSSSSPPANAINGFARRARSSSHVIYLNAHAELRFGRCDGRPFAPTCDSISVSLSEFMRAFDCGAECRVRDDENNSASGAQAILLALIMTVVRKLKPPHKTLARAHWIQVGDIFAIPLARTAKYMGGKIVCLCMYSLRLCVYNALSAKRVCFLTFYLQMLSLKLKIKWPVNHFISQQLAPSQSQQKSYW